MWQIALREGLNTILTYLDPLHLLLGIVPAFLISGSPPCSTGKVSCGFLVQEPTNGSPSVSLPSPGLFWQFVLARSSPCLLPCTKLVPVLVLPPAFSIPVRRLIPLPSLFRQQCWEKLAGYGHFRLLFWLS